MRINMMMLCMLIVMPMILYVVEYWLAKNQHKAALILPIVVACFMVIFGLYAIMVAAIMFVIYYIQKLKHKKASEELSELEKMRLNDL